MPTWTAGGQCVRMYNDDGTKLPEAWTPAIRQVTCHREAHGQGRLGAETYMYSVRKSNFGLLKPSPQPSPMWGEGWGDAEI